MCSVMPKELIPEGWNGLKEVVDDGGISMVLGAGVSKSWGAPSWDGLAKEMLGKAKIENQTGLNIPLIFEAACLKLGEEKFVSILRKLIAHTDNPLSDDSIQKSQSTLAILARLVRAEWGRKPIRKLVRVISLNADDLLEQAVAVLSPNPKDEKPPPLKVISRASHHPGHGTLNPSIPIYHVHGYLPQILKKTQWHEDSPDSLVFTDSQYWATTSSPTSFANRVMLNALHDSHCLFIGLSMTDSNILRWLSIRAEEVTQDKMEQFKKRDDKATQKTIKQALKRHYWICQNSDDSSNILTSVLAARGVDKIAINSWEGGHGSFSSLVSHIFGG